MMHSTKLVTMFRRARAGFRHAFAVGDPELTPEEKEVLDRAARIVVAKRLGGPASFLLESSRPLNFVASQMLAFLEPFLAGTLGSKRFAHLQQALEKRASIDYFLDVIERKEARGESPMAANETDSRAPRP